MSPELFVLPGLFDTPLGLRLGTFPHDACLDLRQPLLRCELPLLRLGIGVELALCSGVFRGLLDSNLRSENTGTL